MTALDNAVEMKAAKGKRYPGDPASAAKMAENTIDFLSAEVQEQVEQTGVGMSKDTTGLPVYLEYDQAEQEEEHTESDSGSSVYSEFNAATKKSWAYNEALRGAKGHVVTSVWRGRDKNWATLGCFMLMLIGLLAWAMLRH